jgi:cyclic-di-GMP-binding protein
VAGINKKNPFVLPERFNPANLEDEYDHKRFKQWISDLPIGNVSNTARALHTELNRLNHLEMSPVERFQALELMLPSIGFIQDKLRAYFLTTTVPLSKKNRLVARLHLELLVRIIVGYKTVLAQFHDDSFTGYLLHKRTRVESARRLLHFQGELLQHEYSIYKVTPKFVWKEAHGVYYYAMRNDLLGGDTSDSEDDLCGPLGITDLYKRLLLMALANPNGMLKGEVKKVNDALPRWLPGVSLSPVDGQGSSQPLFLVDAQRDAPPFHAEDYDIGHIKKGWILDTNDLEEVLEQEVKSIQGDDGSRLRPIDVVSVRLLSKLQDAWGRGTVSRDERRKKAGIIDVTSGLGSLFQLLGGELLPGSPTDRSESPFAAIEDADIDLPAPTLGHDEFIIEAGAELSTGYSRPEGTGEEEAREEEIELDILGSVSVDEIDSRECISVNESARGCYLTWPGEGEYKVQVGELIGINPRENLDLREAWSLGIIRWVRIQSHGLTGFGVELLEGDIEPVRLERWSGSDTRGELMLGFRQKAADNSYSVITQPFYIGDKDKFMLTTASEQLQVLPGRIQECTDAIMRFGIEVDGGAMEQRETDQAKYSASDDPFSTLWDDLDI